MPKLGSLKYQITQRLQKLDRTGESKHHAKERYRDACEASHIPWNPALAEGVYSHQTTNAYRQTGFEFVAWIKEQHPEIRDINAITKEHAINYLQTRDTYCSAYTVSKDMSAINKLLEFNLNKKDIGLKERSYKDTTRSRTPSPEDRKYNPANWERQITVARAFGVRRESIVGGQYQVKDVSLFKRDGRVYISVIEKGGRYNEKPCLKSMQNQIEKMYPDIQERGKLNKEEFKEIYRDRDSSEKLFDRYTRKIDNHAFRAQYARDYYKELVEEKLASGQQIKSDYRGFDKELILKVSEALSHNRPSVVVEHYMR